MMRARRNGTAYWKRFNMHLVQQFWEFVLTLFGSLKCETTPVKYKLSPDYSVGQSETKSEPAQNIWGQNICSQTHSMKVINLIFNTLSFGTKRTSTDIVKISLWKCCFGVVYFLNVFLMWHFCFSEWEKPPNIK